MNQPIMIFLDFDGVTHRWFSNEPGAERFEYLPRIESILRDFPDARIVICSDWRKNTPWSEILSVFADDIRDRVIGVTPVLSSEDVKTGLRHAEAQVYLRENQLDPDRWIALDDYTENWIDDPRFILCDNGFFDKEETLLTEALKWHAQT